MAANCLAIVKRAKTGIHPLRHARVVARFEGSTVAGTGVRTLEDLLQQVVMIAIQSPRGDGPPAAPQHTVNYLVVSAATRHYCQPHIRPELPLSAKPVRRAYYRHKLRHAYGT